MLEAPFNPECGSHKTTFSDTPSIEDAQAYFLRAKKFEEVDDREAAIAAYRQALAQRREFPEAANDLAVLLAARGDSDSAEKLYRQALLDHPDFFAAHLNLANLLLRSERALEASYLLHQATALDPRSVAAWTSLGEALRRTGRQRQAIEAARHAIAVDDTDAGAWNTLGAAYYDLGKHTEAREAWMTALDRNRAYRPAWSNLLLISNYTSAAAREADTLHREFGRLLCEEAGEPRPLSHPDLRPERPLRIGFLSGDLRHHSVSYFIESFLPFLDRSAWQAWAFFTHPTPDLRSEALRPLFDNWVKLADSSNDEACEMIRRQRIDILVDLAGHTNHSRPGVFARQPAPVQVAWIGYPNTTGIERIHYRITDAIADPPGSEAAYTETLWRLPRPFLCHAPPADAPEVAPPPCLENGFVTFGSFNARQKLNDETFALWSRVLAAVPGSRLLLKTHVDATGNTVRESLLALATAHGIATDRLVLLPPEDTPAAHLARYGEMDIALDTFPYHGTTTTCEALWMGVPVITRRGDVHTARVGASLLSAAGHPEWIAGDDEEFVRIAAELAADSAHLAELRATLRGKLRHSPLQDGPGMAAALGDALREMWRRYCTTSPSGADASPPPVSAVNRAISLVDGTRIVTKNDVSSLTAWVMAEQEDWFEDEIKFLRCLCEPGWTVLDIGANHGVYALALAACGARVWAFEPTEEPRARFCESIALNGFNERVRVLPFGLSDTTRSANMTLSWQSEYNSLATGSGGGPQQAIRLLDIDHGLTAQGITLPPIDFVKLDAEGEEEAILRGAEAFLAADSPLVLFEYLNGNIRNSSLVDAFRTRGFGIYRLLPGIGCLVPVAPGEEARLDSFTLNLFAAKPDRAARLAERGFLVPSLPSPSLLDTAWLEELRAMPVYAASDANPDWLAAESATSPYSRALLAWCGSRRAALPSSERAALLFEARRHVAEDIASEEGHPATALLAIRVLSELNERALAIAYAQATIDQLTADDLPVDRPVPPALADFDHRPPGGAWHRFVFASLLEFAFRRSAASSFVIGTPLDLLNAVLANPDHSIEAERRALLCCIRDHRPLRLPLSARVFHLAPDNRNPDLWFDLASAHGMLAGVVGEPDAAATPTDAAAPSIGDFLESDMSITVIDIGASFNGDPPYQGLLDQGRARLIGFEPNDAERNKLMEAYRDTHRILPHFVGDGRQRTFYETNWALTGSLFKPNTPLLRSFQLLDEVTRLVAEHNVATVRLDDIPELEDVDFLKMDIQGAELMVLENAIGLLRQAVCIQVEVEFVEMYENQPLFSEVDSFLRGQGFQFHTFLGFGMRCFAPVHHPITDAAGIRQNLWSDAVYVRDWMAFERLPLDKLLKLAVLLHDVFASYDLAHLALLHADRLAPQAEFCARYRRLLGRRIL